MSGKRECPYCKEEIQAEAIKCKHCLSKIASPKPQHEGICPFCKEEVKLDATKCKHCGSQMSMEIGDARQLFDCNWPPAPGIIASALRVNQNNTGYSGNDCYESCRVFMESRGAMPIYAHMMCQDACRISMPWPNVYFRT